VKLPLESLIFNEWFILGTLKMILEEDEFMEWGGYEVLEDVVEPD